MPPTYTVYGLRIDAGTSLPGLLRDDRGGPADVCVRLGEWPTEFRAVRPFYVTGERTPEGEPELVIGVTPDGALYHLRYADGLEFAVDRAGTTVWGRWPASSTDADALTYLLTPVLGFVLRLRGVTALHGSAVTIDGGAVVVLGPSGAGKSTTAGALAARGCAVLADDVVALREPGDVPLVYPAYTHLRLWPESADLLLGTDLPSLTPTWDKRRLDLLERPGYRMQTEPAVLRVVYVLAPRVDAPDAPRVELMDGQTALLTLVANVYGATVPIEEARRRDFALLGRVVRDVAVRRVVAHADPARVGALCECITADVRQG